jgi:hypothetical protein
MYNPPAKHCLPDQKLQYPITTISVASKSVDTSLRVKVMVVLSPALSLSTSLLMAIVGTLVSIVKSTELFASAPSTLIFPAASLNLSLATEIVPPLPLL